MAFRVTSEVAAEIREGIAKTHLQPGQFYLAATAMLLSNVDAFQAGYMSGQQLAHTLAKRLIVRQQKENARHVQERDSLFREFLDLTWLVNDTAKETT